MIDREPSHDLRPPHARPDAAALSAERLRGRRSWSARAQRELAGTLHLVRLERLAARLRDDGPVAAEVVARRRAASVLTFRLSGDGWAGERDEMGWETVWEMVWWSFWSRPLDVTQLLDLSWRNDVGWKALFRPAPSTPLDAPGVAVTDDGHHLVRLFAHHAELRPLG